MQTALKQAIALILSQDAELLDIWGVTAEMRPLWQKQSSFRKIYSV